jgi:hypothetical protein
VRIAQMSIWTRTNLGFVSVTAPNTATGISGRRRRYEAWSQRRGGPSRRENRQLAAESAGPNPGSQRHTVKSYKVSLSKWQFRFLANRIAGRNPLAGLVVLPRLGLDRAATARRVYRCGSPGCSASVLPNLRRPRRLTRSKPRDHASPVRSGSHESPHQRASWCAAVWVGASEFRGRLRCKFGHGTGGISHADHRRVGPR